MVFGQPNSTRILKIMTQFHDLSECDQNVLLSLVITGGVSVVAGIMILLSFVLIKKIRTYTFGLIFMMSKFD